MDVLYYNLEILRSNFYICKCDLSFADPHKPCVPNQPKLGRILSDTNIKTGSLDLLIWPEESRRIRGPQFPRSRVMWDL